MTFFTLDQFNVVTNHDSAKTVVVHSGTPSLAVLLVQYGEDDAQILSLPHHTHSYSNPVEIQQILDNMTLASAINNDWLSFWANPEKWLAKHALDTRFTVPDCAMKLSDGLTFWNKLDRRHITHFRYASELICIEGDFIEEGKFFKFCIGLGADKRMFTACRKLDGSVHFGTLPCDYGEECHSIVTAIIYLKCAIAYDFEQFIQNVDLFIAETLD